MTSKYDEIYNIFLGKITDYRLANLSYNEAYEIMGDYFRTVTADSAVIKLFSSIEFDDEVATITYEMRKPIGEQHDKRYVENLFATGMVVEWLRPQIETVEITSQFIGGNKEKFYAQSNHGNALKDLFRKTSDEFSKMTSKHGYANFVLNGAQS